MTNDDTGLGHEPKDALEAIPSRSDTEQPQNEETVEVDHPPNGGYGWICVACSSLSVHINYAPSNRISKVLFS